MTEPRQLRRDDFTELSRVSTRWSDNDMFGHLNNAVYYELFDSVLNDWLMRETGIDESAAATMGVVAESSCRFYRELAYPEPVDVAVRVERAGTTSLIFEMGIFAVGVDQIAAHGRWVQVYVERESRRTVALPPEVRALADRSLEPDRDEAPF